jgi:hypothetical protein
MKKFIYAIILLAGFQFAQAQQVDELGVYSISPSGELSTASLEGAPLGEQAVPENVTYLRLPIYVQFKNTLFDTIKGNGKGLLLSTVLFNNEFLENDSAYVFPSIVLKDSTGYLLTTVLIPISRFKEGTNANKLCFQVTDIVDLEKLLQYPVNTNSFCANFSIKIVVGISDINNLQEVKVFPNPVRENNLKIENLDEATDIHLYNITGQLIQSASSAMGNIDMNVSNLSNGLYILKMQSGKNTRTEKIQIIH